MNSKMENKPTCPRCGSELAHQGTTGETKTPYIKWVCNSVNYDGDGGYFCEAENCLRNQLAAANKRIAELESA